MGNVPGFGDAHEASAQAADSREVAGPTDIARARDLSADRVAEQDASEVPVDLPPDVVVDVADYQPDDALNALGAHVAATGHVSRPGPVLPAGLPARIGTPLVDGLLLAILSGCVFAIGLSLVPAASSSWESFSPLAVALGYTLWDVIARGTPGRQLCDAVIARPDGMPASSSALLARWALRNPHLLFALLAVPLTMLPGDGLAPLFAFVAIATPAVQLVLGVWVLANAVAVLASSDRRALWDHACGTAVISRGSLRSRPRGRAFEVVRG